MIMKRITQILLAFLFLVSVNSAIGQDMRSFTGSISSAKRLQTKGSESRISLVETKMTFLTASIEVGADVYEIVNKEWDGEAVTTFTCEKGRSTFYIVFEAGKSIEIRPDEAEAIITRFEELKTE